MPQSWLTISICCVADINFFANYYIKYLCGDGDILKILIDKAHETRNWELKAILFSSDFFVKQERIVYEQCHVIIKRQKSQAHFSTWKGNATFPYISSVYSSHSSVVFSQSFYTHFLLRWFSRQPPFLFLLFFVLCFNKEDM